MAKDNSSSNEVLVPIDMVVARTGFPSEAIWQALREGEVAQDWSYAYCVSPSRARELVDLFTAAREASDKANAEMRERQEQEIRQTLDEAQERANEKERQRPTPLGALTVQEPPSDAHWAREAQ